MAILIMRGNIWIENENGHLIGPGRKKLLEAIRNTGSIKEAAKTMKMSYRHAWEMINDMNKISVNLLVEKSAGGTSGGGSYLTTEGEKLIAAYDDLDAAFQHFKLKMNKTLSFYVP